MKSPTFAPIEVDRQSVSQAVQIDRVVNYEPRLTNTEHLYRIGQISRKQTRGSDVDWQDAVQEVQLKLIAAVRGGKFRSGTPQDFDRWAATVARFAIIDLVRRSKCHQTESLDRELFDNIALLDLIADPCDLLATIERADLIYRIRVTIIDLDRAYPDRSYYRLWLAKVHEKKQTQIAQELGLTQGAISKRWQELLARLTLSLNLAPTTSSCARARSKQQW